MIEASNQPDNYPVVRRLTLVHDEAQSETALADAGAHRLLAAVAELQLHENEQRDELSQRRQKVQRG